MENNFDHYGLSGPPLSDHFHFTFLVVADRRLDCNCIYLPPKCVLQDVQYHSASNVSHLETVDENSLTNISKFTFLTKLLFYLQLFIYVLNVCCKLFILQSVECVSSSNINRKFAKSFSNSVYLTKLFFYVQLFVYFDG